MPVIWDEDEPELEDLPQWKRDKLLFQAAKAGDMETAYNLLEAGARPDGYTDTDYGSITTGTSLHAAAYNGHYQMAEYLIDYDADLHARDKYGYTALHIASYQGQIGCAQMLINKGISINDMDFTVDPNESVWEEFFDEASGKPFWSHKVSDESVWDYNEIDPADLHPAPRQGYTSLHRAAMNGQWKAVEMLLQNGADLRATDNLGRTVLHHACIIGHLETAEGILKAGEPKAKKAAKRARGRGSPTQTHNKSNPEFSRVDSLGLTCLHLAAQQGRTDVVTMLVRYGNELHTAKHLSAKDNRGKTPLDLARANKKTACVSALEAWRWIVAKEAATEKANKTKSVMTGL